MLFDVARHGPLCRRVWGELLWRQPSHEATPAMHDPPPGPGLWAAQAHGRLCKPTLLILLELYLWAFLSALMPLPQSASMLSECPKRAKHDPRMREAYAIPCAYMHIGYEGCHNEGRSIVCMAMMQTTNRVYMQVHMVAVHNSCYLCHHRLFGGFMPKTPAEASPAASGGADDISL